MEIKELIKDYVEDYIPIEKLASKYHIGKLKVKKILTDNNIKLRTHFDVKKRRNFVVSDWKIEKYPKVEGKHYIAVSKKDGTTYNDYLNNAGLLTTYINKVYDIAIPTIYDRRIYYQETGNYWYEQWFDIKLVDNKEVKKCPYCDWETIDIDNKSGAFEMHLKKAHNKSKIEYLEEHPEDREYFKLACQTLDLQMELDESKFVICPICNKKFKFINANHIHTHGLTKLEFIQKYGKCMCKDTKEKFSNLMKERNVSMLDNVTSERYESKGENELKNYIRSLGFECDKNRKLLAGKELDMYIPSLSLAIEYNGNKWHSEWFGGKDKYYHLSNTEECNKKGIKLIQIFEDEYEYNKEIVHQKIKHILGASSSMPKIPGRKCKIIEISKNEAEIFLNKYHIQGFSKSTVYLGAFYNDELVGVMTFIKEKENEWNLNRFASNYNYIFQGIGGKIFSYFIKKYRPTIVKSFADRRWTLSTENNLYTNLGFKFDGYTAPDYHYYNTNVDRYKRFHKFNFRKQRLHKKYNLPLTMTEIEMAKKLGFDRIWDCGLIRYIWHA